FVDGFAVGANEQTGRNSGGSHARQAVAEAPFIAQDVESSLGGNLLPSLRNEHHLMWTEPLGDGEHFVGARHLQIEPGGDRCGETLDIVVLNVASVFAKVRGDA